MLLIHKILIVYIVLFHYKSNCLHLVGEWNTRDFYKFLVKFGFQKTDNNDEKTQGYIYGNITIDGLEPNTEVSLVVLDSEYFLEFLKNRLIPPKTEACLKMFAKIKDLIWDKTCNVQGKEDFIRYIPCKKDSLCRDEHISRVVRGSQFTFKVRDNIQPRYWYVSLVACSLGGKSCKWSFQQKEMLIKYDLWFVNGDPKQWKTNLFEHQFSVEQFDLFEIHLAFLILYLLLLPLQCYAVYTRRHTVAWLLLVCMLIELLALIWSFVHYSRFAADGVGCEWCLQLGKFLDLISQSCFMLLLLLVVKGLSITSNKLPFIPTISVALVWCSYTAANIGLFFWNMTAVQFISDVDEWQTLPGFLILSFRICIMLWFLWELKNTFLLDHGILRSRFYLHFGAGFMTWFIYLPLVVMVCYFLSPFHRLKTILGVCFSVNYFSFVVSTHLMWPSKKYLYFNFNPFSKEYEKDSLFHDDDYDDEDEYDF